MIVVKMMAQPKFIGNKTFEARENVFLQTEDAVEYNYLFREFTERQIQSWSYQVTVWALDDIMRGSLNDS
jgi:hypothetical protein